MDKKIEERWIKGTKELIKKLESKKVDFKQFETIELFGRDGSWQTSEFAKIVKSIEIWEIELKWEEKLKKIPNSTIKIKDSISALKSEINLPKFDLILIDNPMNIFGKEKNCEHFEVFQNIKKIAKNDVLVIFNVNRQPFDYEKFPLWKKRRNEFYGDIDTSDMKIKFLIEIYIKKFLEIGFNTIFCTNAVRVFYEGIDMTHYFAYKLKKI
jgi:hypothetical protein|tara:strand:+ start:5042 stop:5674 length:633 start_codon:yes stop_codon:yes gene_type:complete